MKKKSRFKVLSGVGKRWKVKYFNNYESAKKYFQSFTNLKKSGFAIFYDFDMQKFTSCKTANGKKSITPWRYFKNA